MVGNHNLIVKYFPVLNSFIILRQNWNRKKVRSPSIKSIFNLTHSPKVIHKDYAVVVNLNVINL